MIPKQNKINEKISQNRKHGKNEPKLTIKAKSIKHILYSLFSGVASPDVVVDKLRGYKRLFLSN